MGNEIMLLEDFLIKAKKNGYAAQGDDASTEPLIPEPNNWNMRKVIFFTGISILACCILWVRKLFISKTNRCGPWFMPAKLKVT